MLSTRSWRHGGDCRAAQGFVARSLGSRVSLHPDRERFISFRILSMAVIPSPSVCLRARLPCLSATSTRSTPLLFCYRTRQAAGHFSREGLPGYAKVNEFKI